jgi:hypothetical protein
MKKTVITSGLISGGFLAGMMSIMMPLCNNGTLSQDNSLIVGYTTMVVALLAVFFGIRSYRDKTGDGTITFGRAFKVGILITLIACAIYVTAWEIIYFNFMPDFADKYAALSLDRMRADGASAAEMVEAEKKMADFKRLYPNPLFNIGMTFIEIFPVGLIVTLVSAAILRRKQTPGIRPAATAAVS